MYGETVTVVRAATGSRNEHGEFVPGTATQTDYEMKSAPMSANDALARELEEAGVRLEDVRVFWVFDLDVDSVRQGATQAQADQLIHQQTYYRVFRVARWIGDRVVIHAIRLDVQP